MEPADGNSPAPPKRDSCLCLVHTPTAGRECSTRPFLKFFIHAYTHAVATHIARDHGCPQASVYHRHRTPKGEICTGNVEYVQSRTSLKRLHFRLHLEE